MTERDLRTVFKSLLLWFAGEATRILQLLWCYGLKKDHILLHFAFLGVSKYHPPREDASPLFHGAGCSPFSFIKASLRSGFRGSRNHGHMSSRTAYMLISGTIPCRLTSTGRLPDPRRAICARYPSAPQTCVMPGSISSPSCLNFSITARGDRLRDDSREALRSPMESTILEDPRRQNHRRRQSG